MKYQFDDNYNKVIKFADENVGENYNLLFSNKCKMKSKIKKIDKYF